MVYPSNRVRLSTRHFASNLRARLIEFMSAPSVSGETETIIASAAEVREKFRRVKPLKEISATQRGWTLDVLNIVRRLVESKLASGMDCGGMTPLSPGETCLAAPERGHVRALQTRFTTSEIYSFERELEQLHPGNRHICDKIRQQLQALRDTGFLIHLGRGEWRLK